jgi:hypothetical protein
MRRRIVQAGLCALAVTIVTIATALGGLAAIGQGWDAAERQWETED